MEKNNYFQTKVQQLINNEIIFAQLQKYVDLVEEKNKVMNLTGFSGDQLWGNAILESIILMQKSFDSKIATNSNLQFLDIGAGAGFPSIPYLISLNSKHDFTIYEPTQKRVDFLNLVKQQLNLVNLTIEKVRAEEVIKFELFDCITARAVSELKNLVLISHHLGKINCLYSFVKGPKYEQEIHEAHKLLVDFKNLDFTPLKVEIAELERINYLIQFSKTSKTPKGHPLKWAQIVK